MEWDPAGVGVDLSLLRTFLAVYRAGSLTAAAPQLGLSQPAVTAQIRSLEGQLGQQLFERLPRGVAPTAVADELARQVSAHLDALAAIADGNRARHDPFAKPVHLAGPAEFIALRVLPALADLVAKGLELRVTAGLADDLLAGLRDRRFDIVISTIRPRVRAVSATPLADEEFVLVAGRAWERRIDPAALGRDAVEALRDVPLVAYGEDLPIIRRYWRSVLGHRPTAGAAVVIPDLRGVLAATVAGMGVTVLPHYLCAEHLDSGDLIPLLRPETPPINTLFLATRTGTTSLAHISAVHRHLIGAARQW